MNRITKRTWIIGLFLLVLLSGLLVFSLEYVTQAEKWVSFSGSPHLYNSSNIGCGSITDRSGELLLDISQGRTYSDNASTRKSTLHWLGDRKGFINAAAVSTYAGAMVGYDRINGVYDATGEGGTARLTLSARVQNAALEAMGNRKGTIGVYNYKTGEILCALTTPTYDPENVPDIASDTSGAYDGVYLNRFVQSAYVPGSIFKIVTLSAALDCVPGIEDMAFPCRGKIAYGTEAVTCEKAHGTQTLKQAFANSCNCAFAQISELVGKNNMVKYVNQFAVTKKLTFDGITTAAGNYDITDTAPVSFAWSCIGQHSDLVNPARYMTFMGAIAGDGVAAEPYLMEHVENGGKTTYQAKTKKTDRLMSEEVARKVAEYMRNNVKSVYGDGNFGGLPVCAKSGTSQLGGDQKSNAMFAGFVDSEDYPLAFIVVVENGGYGSHTCVPVLSKVLAACKSVLDGE
ncbi:MAG: penicillin-binding transpeptidase domain-containing protein [Candidatus Faecousia sp.]|nr:penicillin-binding transpeptidase domain-containing protein [Candidatus Faecousia sp.]